MNGQSRCFKAFAIAALATAMATAADAQVDHLPSGRYSLGTLSPVTFYCSELPEGADPANERCVGYYDGWASAVYLSDYLGGNVFAGHWVMTVSSQNCGYDIGGSPYWGRVEFTFAEDGNSWTGLWGFCEETPTRVWDGRR